MPPQDARAWGDGDRKVSRSNRHGLSKPKGLLQENPEHKDLKGECVGLEPGSNRNCLPRKAPFASPDGVRTKTDTGWRGEYPKALERTLVKELGKITP